MRVVGSEINNLSKKERLHFFKQQKELEKENVRRKSFILKGGLVFASIIVISFFGYLWVNAKPVDTSSRPSEGLRSIGNLKLGDPAPHFSLLSTDGKEFSLDQYADKNVLLYFNEGVMCAPCWKQISTMQQKLDKFEEIGTEVLTIAIDSANDWKPILKAENITTIPVLIDADRKVSDAYGVLQMPSQMHSDRPGHTYILVDKGGMVRWIGDYPTMRVTDEEVIASISEALKKEQ